MVLDIAGLNSATPHRGATARRHRAAPAHGAVDVLHIIVELGFCKTAWNESGVIGWLRQHIGSTGRLGCASFDRWQVSWQIESDGAIGWLWHNGAAGIYSTSC